MLEEAQNAMLNSLARYRDLWIVGRYPYLGQDTALEEKTWADLDAFIRREPQCLERACAEGHITASALIVNPSRDKVLLTLHAKLGMWVQLGGHVDGEHDIAAAALREAQEESGREEIYFLDWESVLLSGGSAVPLPFDCDIHEIPARKTEAAHKHFDLRYLFVLDDSLPLVISEESKDLRWLRLDEAEHLTQEPSMLRQFAKIRALEGLLITVR